MIYKCPNCSAALSFDPDTNKLICRSCDSSFHPEKIDTTHIPSMRMEFHIYSCTACGAELMVTPTEAATYCIYCGQPVIVFDRVSSELQPDYIIPFKISSDIAEKSLRFNIRKKFFVPKEFKNFKKDLLRGIYIPFWLYDIEYHDKQYFSVTRKTLGGMAEKRCAYCKEVETVFKNLPMNASAALNDDELQLLGKYYLEEKVPFNAGYLSGFYADRYDIDYNQAESQIIKKAEDIFDREIEQSLYQKKYESIFKEYKNPQINIKRISYVMLPVWFMTFRYKGQPYSLLVNGQTGTAAGNLPIQKSKAIILFSLISAIVAPIFGFLDYWVYLSYINNQLDPFRVVLIIIPFLFYIIFGLVFGHIGMGSIIKGLKFSRSTNVHHFVKERQDI